MILWLCIQFNYSSCSVLADLRSRQNPLSNHLLVTDVILISGGTVVTCYQPSIKDRHWPPLTLKPPSRAPFCFTTVFNVFFGQKMPLKLLRTLMSNWINVEEDDIDHDEDAASKMIPEMLTLTRYILWHHWSHGHWRWWWWYGQVSGHGTAVDGEWQCRLGNAQDDCHH